MTSGAVRPSQGKTLAVMQVSGGSQSFNAVNQMRILGRWMRMITIPNQSSVAKAWAEFEEDGCMKPSPYYDRIGDVMEELRKFTLLTRGCSDYLTDRYSERKESAAQLSERVNQRSVRQKPTSAGFCLCVFLSAGSTLKNQWLIRFPCSSMTFSPSSFVNAPCCTSGRISRTASDGRQSFVPSGVTTTGRLMRMG